MSSKFLIVMLAAGFGWRIWLGEWALIGWGLLAAVGLALLLVAWNPTINFVKKLTGIPTV